MAAALLAMVANLTLTRKRFAAVHSEAKQVRDEAFGLRDRASTLVDADIEAYGRVSNAMSLPRETDGEKAFRSDQLQNALKEAAMPPLEVMRVASRVVQLAVRTAEVGNPSAISDVGTAALAARAAFHAARLNVEINASAVRDIEWVAGLRREVSSIPVPDETEERILAGVGRRIRGEGN
jgi:formiminotetrahydrofolate cyclodeaminase